MTEEYHRSMVFSIHRFIMRLRKTWVSYPSPKTGGDHPRSCGKDFNPNSLTALTPGSPPLVRERQAVEKRYTDVTGLTPARAGKTAGAS